MVAPVQYDDLQPTTSLFMDIVLALETREVTIMSQIFVNEDLTPNVMGTDIPELEILPEDMSDDMLSEETVGKIRDLLSGFSLLTTVFLAILIKTRAEKKNRERKG